MGNCFYKYLYQDIMHLSGELALVCVNFTNYVECKNKYTEWINVA